MSRIGRTPIPILEGVNISLADEIINIEGPKGKFQHKIPRSIKVEIANGQILVKREGDAKLQKSLHGLTRTLINNMVIGVHSEFNKMLQIDGVGYRAELDKKDIIIRIGFSHQVRIAPHTGITFEVPEPTKIKISGIDKGLVGQTAANIRDIRCADPYKLKGIKYLGEVIKKKVGKTGIGAGTKGK